MDKKKTRKRGSEGNQLLLYVIEVIWLHWTQILIILVRTVNLGKAPNSNIYYETKWRRHSCGYLKLTRSRLCILSKSFSRYIQLKICHARAKTLTFFTKRKTASLPFEISYFRHVFPTSNFKSPILYQI